MAHVNQQVRDEFATRLGTVGGLTSVFSNRGADLYDDVMPAAVIETVDDQVSRESKGFIGEPALQKRVIDVSVVVVASGAMADIDDTLDALRVDIEEAIATDEDLGGIAQDVIHTGGSLRVGSDEEGANWYAFLTLTWQVHVWTELGDSETAVS